MDRRKLRFSGAKEIYEDMFSNSKEVIDRYAIILLMNKYEKIAALESFTGWYPKSRT